ncbi:MAG: hypothetical protein COB63_04380 [Candidatus Pelagibacter sp.]|nr:MAG: hypothetical protein COB63_04380 [Candidatus Pelagibacter sp.]
MSIVAKGGEKSSSFPSVSVGVHKARCVKVIDLGTQKNEFEGNITWKRQILVIWEVPEQTSETSEPLTISKFYTLSLHEKSNLGIDLTSWRGRPFSETEKKGFDISKLIGHTCLLNVIQGNKNNKIGSIMPLPKGDKIAEQYHTGVVFDLEKYQKGQKEIFNQLSEGIRNIILRSKELEGLEHKDNGDDNNGSTTVGQEPVPF